MPRIWELNRKRIIHPRLDTKDRTEDDDTIQPAYPEGEREGAQRGGQRIWFLSFFDLYNKS